jgi:hypothetical protein
MDLHDNVIQEYSGSVQHFPEIFKEKRLLQEVALRIVIFTVKLLRSKWAYFWHKRNGGNLVSPPSGKEVLAQLC